MENYGLIEKVRKINYVCPHCNNKRLKYDINIDEDDFTTINVSCTCGYKTSYDENLVEISSMPENAYSNDDYYDDFFDEELSDKLDLLTDKYDCCPFCGGVPLKFFKYHNGEQKDDTKRKIVSFLIEHNYCDETFNELNVCKCDCGWFAFCIDDNEEENEILKEI